MNLVIINQNQITFHKSKPGQGLLLNQNESLKSNRSNFGYINLMGSTLFKNEPQIGGAFSLMSYQSYNQTEHLLPV